MKVEEIIEHLGIIRTGADSWLFHEDSQQVRKRILSDAAYLPYLEQLVAEGDRFLQTPIPDLAWSLFRRIWEDGNRKTYEAVYFHRRQRLAAFGLLSWLWPEREDYRDGLLDIVWAICNEFSWCVPAHYEQMPGHAAIRQSVLDPHIGNHDPALEIDLFAAETAFTLAEILQLTGEGWPEAVRGRIYREIYRRVFIPYLNNAYFWEAVRNNWAAVCAGSIAAAAIYVIEDSQELAMVLEKALPILDLFLEGFGEDGACLEGYMYWSYGFGFYTYAAQLLERRTAGGINLFEHPKVKEIALFQQKSFLTGRKTVNFSDSQDEADVNIGLTHEWARRVPDMHIPEYSFEGKLIYDHCGRFAPALRKLIWFDVNLKGTDWEEASYYLPDAQWLISRVHQPNGSFCFAAKGGYNDEPHNHNDIGHFMLTAGEETFLADMGAGLYTKQYFSPARYTFIGNGAQGHSIPMINHELQLTGKEIKAKVLKAEIGPDDDRFTLDLKDTYGQLNLHAFERSWTWQKDCIPPRLQLEDHFEFTEGINSVKERFICAMEPKSYEQGRVQLEGIRYRLVIQFDHELLNPSVEQLKFLNHFGKDVTFYALDFIRKQDLTENTQRFRFAFYFEFI
ncbi:heparinase II/III family protein [Paenibacillus qinlingensis]|uniref:Heparinase II/III-like protein n=1 Tax=Paenibacillus qinlingensis TaxID=1837343 RepID=A0ABU1NQX7_9BACL|nr:heparinase II/III family protein [Paenibacillus qinlingensis]MDR6549854.1 hypothetical protein [Paenibacillus qinlingensis]